MLSNSPLSADLLEINLPDHTLSDFFELSLKIILYKSQLFARYRFGGHFCSILLFSNFFLTTSTHFLAGRLKNDVNILEQKLVSLEGGS